MFIYFSMIYPIIPMKYLIADDKIQLDRLDTHLSRGFEHRHNDQPGSDHQWLSRTGALHNYFWAHRMGPPLDSVQLPSNVNPGLINPVYGCLVGRVPFKYQIMTIGGIPP